MRRKMIVLLLVMALVAAIAGPAAAKKKKPKGPKPYKSEEVTIEAGHPVFFSTTGTVASITAQEFIQACALPSSNGLDAYVFEVPKDYQGVNASIQAFGVAGPSGLYDIDIYIFDSECSSITPFNSTSQDEMGVLAPGAAFILIHNYEAGPTTVHFELKPATF